MSLLFTKSLKQNIARCASLYFKYSYGYDYDDYYTAYEELLVEMAHCFGADENDVIMLLDYGYTADEVSDLMMDTSLFQETVSEVKLIEGEGVYDSYCYGGVF